ncbi:hypothetical protein K2173_001004 [Erythroxylum novogranatense]|uniref:Amino acid transporter transmembrane domain-containing protein n=1 Tax=Erythroxylum novogranatense TaxID=1862640 RepID=A0AAV8S7D2_9ROSI|nr:hypothetical protein K2173_001004 [Erythroxylum novogranatense]
MDSAEKLKNVEFMNIEDAGANADHNRPDDQGVISAHTVGQDSWQQMGFLLVTGFNCGYLLSYSSLIMAPTGWTWSIILLFVIGFYCAYGNWLLAEFHFIGGKRFIRYRDLMGFVFGKYFYYLTYISQFTSLCLANMGFILLGGRALKASIFHHLRGTSLFLICISDPNNVCHEELVGGICYCDFSYIILLMVMAVEDGLSNKSRSYDVGGSQVSKVFNAFAAISVVNGANSGGFLPELQSTLRQPAIKNMRKALLAQFTLGLFFYYGVTVIGYWAYGSSVSWYLPQQISGPKWVKILINALVFLQSVVSQMFNSFPNGPQQRALVGNDTVCIKVHCCVLRTTCPHDEE